jgi:hypothetical protein
MVQYYKRLKTRNNPFSYRQQILSLIYDLEYDVEKKASGEYFYGTRGFESFAAAILINKCSMFTSERYCP